MLSSSSKIFWRFLIILYFLWSLSLILACRSFLNSTTVIFLWLKFILAQILFTISIIMLNIFLTCGEISLIYAISCDRFYILLACWLNWRSLVDRLFTTRWKFWLTYWANCFTNIFMLRIWRTKRGYFVGLCNKLWYFQPIVFSIIVTFICNNSFLHLTCQKISTTIWE